MSSIQPIRSEFLWWCSSKKGRRLADGQFGRGVVSGHPFASQASINHLHPRINPPLLALQHLPLARMHISLTCLDRSIDQTKSRLVGRLPAKTGGGARLLLVRRLSEEGKGGSKGEHEAAAGSDYGVQGTRPAVGRQEADSVSDHRWKSKERPWNGASESVGAVNACPSTPPTTESPPRACTATRWCSSTGPSPRRCRGC